MPNLSVTHQSADRFELQVRGHRLTCDQPVAAGGTDQGPTPTELFVGSLAACVAFYARRFLARHHLDAAGLRVQATYTMSPDRPARVDTITLQLLLPHPLEENRRQACWRSSTTAPSTLPPHPTRGARHAGRARRHQPRAARHRRRGTPRLLGGQVMQLDEGTTADVLARLRRIQGQVGGIIRMVEAGRGCREVVQQISAAGRALDQTGFKILASGLRHCLQDEQAAEQAGYSQDELEKLFLQLR